MRDLNDASPPLADRYHVICECGEPSCFSRLELPWQVYEDVRRAERQFVVAPGHEQPGEDCVLVFDDGYRIVTV